MEIQFIKEFLVLAECLNFGEAAAQLNMTQSNLSKHIQSLERELDNALFDRTSRSVKLSNFGEYYLPYARKILADCKEADEAVRLYSRKRVNSFCVAVVRNPQYYVIDKILISFHEKYPDCRINMIECDEQEARKLFLSKQVNLFASYGPEMVKPDYNFIPTGHNNVVAVLPAGHALATQHEITVEQLKRETLLLPSRSTRMSQMILEALGIADPRFSLNVVYEGGSSVCIDFVKAGIGISLQPKETVKYLSDIDIQCIDVLPHISYCYGLGYRDEQLSREESCFVKYLSQKRFFSLY